MSLQRLRDLEFIVYEGSQEVSRIPWQGQRLLIGRRSDVDVQIGDPTLSAAHAEILEIDGRLRVRDLKSLNGTQINGVRISEAPIKAGDWIKLGEVMLRVGHSADISLPPPVPTSEGSPSSETLRISLDLLQERRRQTLDDDRSIRLLSDLFESLKTADDRTQIFDEVRASLREAFPSARIYVLERNENGEWLDPEADLDDDRPSQTVALEAVRSNDAVLSTYLPQDARFAGADSIKIKGIKTVIAAPTRCDGEPVAVIYVDRLGLPAFTRDELSLLGIASNHLSALLDNAARIAELRQTNRELEKTRERLKKLNDHLEEEVEKRTAEIRQRKTEIAELAEAKDELLGIAAHDIRGPLTVIQGNAELLRLRLDQLDPPALDRSLAVIHDAAKGLSQLLSELLDARAIESGKIHLQRRRYGVGQLLREACAVGRLAAEAVEIEIEIDSEPGQEVVADPRRLGQAISNLVLNAIKFSQPGTKIQVRSGTAEGRCEIVVEDEGMGISEDDLDRVFQAFERGEAGKQASGTGLGLMIARRLVELHGGELSVTSRVGEGSRFVIHLPAREPRDGQER